MFCLFRKHKNKALETKEPIFCAEGIIDVTNFDAMSPDDSLGYMSAGIVSIFENGQIEMRTVDKTKDLLESISISHILHASNNINNYDPEHAMEVALTTENKALQIAFHTKEDKAEFWETLTSTFNKLKEDGKSSNE